MNAKKFWLFYVLSLLPAAAARQLTVTDLGATPAVRRNTLWGGRFTVRRLVGLLLLLVPGFALAQVPTYTLVDLGSANVPNGTGWPDADCIGHAAGTDAQGHPVYICHSWTAETILSLSSLAVDVGYALLPAPANQTQPVENYVACCGAPPPPYEGLKAFAAPIGIADVRSPSDLGLRGRPVRRRQRGASGCEKRHPLGGRGPLCAAGTLRKRCSI